MEEAELKALKAVDRRGLKLGFWGWYFVRYMFRLNDRLYFENKTTVRIYSSV